MLSYLKPSLVWNVYCFCLTLELLQHSDLRNAGWFFISILAFKNITKQVPNSVLELTQLSCTDVCILLHMFVVFPKRFDYYCANIREIQLSYHPTHLRWFVAIWHTHTHTHTHTHHFMRRVIIRLGVGQSCLRNVSCVHHVVKIRKTRSHKIRKALLKMFFEMPQTFTLD